MRRIAKLKALLLHGPGIKASRIKLQELRSKFHPDNVVVFEEGAASMDIADNLVSTSLFSDERLVILENPPEDFVLATNYELPTTLLLWFDHEIGEKKEVMKWIKENKGESLFFPESKEISIFPFLDLLAQGNMKAFLEMKKLKDARYDIFYFNTMTLYLLRNLVATPKTALPFVKEKLKKQRIRFNQQNLTNLYKNILELDFKLKSGLIESQQAEFLLVNQFLKF